MGGRAPPRKDDGRSHKARAQLGRTWRWGVLCAAGPSPVPRLPIPSPHSSPTRRSSRHSRQNIFKEIGQKWKPPPHMVPCYYFPQIQPLTEEMGPGSPVRVDLPSVLSVALKSSLLSNQESFATIVDMSENPIQTQVHRLCCTIYVDYRSLHGC